VLSSRVDSSNLTSAQTRRICVAIEPMRKYLGTLIKRCRELQFMEDDPLLRAAVVASMRLDDLEREAMRAALKHGDEKRALDMSERDVRRA
jgi:hypothetical protein